MSLGARVLLVDSQLETRGAFVSLAPLVLAAISEREGASAEVVRFPRHQATETFLATAARADVVALSTLCTNYPRVLLLASELKRRSPRTVIVLGGPQASVTAGPTLMAYPAVDLILRGEAEPAWAEFSRQTRKRAWDFARIPGAVWRDATGLRETALAQPTADLDETPIPLFSAHVPSEPYATARVEVGRGCRYRCAFCSTSAYFNRDYRMKSPARIGLEMTRIYETYGTRRFDFVHDMFTSDRRILEKTCDGLARLPFEWGCWSRADVLDRAQLEMLYASGCRGFFFGLETGSPRLQRKMQKGLDVHESVNVLRTAKRMGFSVTAALILGYPGETRDDLRDTLLLAMELLAGAADQVNLLPFGPLAGTPAANLSPLTFDGATSNFATTGEPLSTEEIRAIRAYPALFSAYYHPADLDYPRSDYLNLIALIDNLGRYPYTSRWILDHDRVAFVEFLVRGRFPLAVGALGETEVAERMLQWFARQSPHGQEVAALLEFERALGRIERATPGALDHGVAPASCAPLLVRNGHYPGAGFDDWVMYVIRSTDRGATVELRRRN